MSRRAPSQSSSALWRHGPLSACARADVAAFASPDTFHWAPTGLPKTRSGKIMRRLLRDVADGRDLGDTTTLADPGVVSAIAEGAADNDED